MMGIGQALTEGTRYDDEGRQRNAMLLEYKLQTITDAPPISIDVVQTTRPTAGRAAPRASPRRRTCDRGRDRERDREADRRATSTAPDDRRARLGAPRSAVMSFTTAASLDDALAALAVGARPIAGGSDLVVGARHGKAPLPGTSSRSIGSPSSAASRRRPTALVIGALVATPTSSRPPRARRATGARRRLRAGRLARDAQRRDARRQPDERSPAMDTGAPLVVLGAEVELRSQAVPSGRRSTSSGPGPGKTPRSPTSCASRSTCRRCRRDRAAPTSGWSTGARWRSRSSAPPRS